MEVVELSHDERPAVRRMAPRLGRHDPHLERETAVPWRCCCSRCWLAAAGRLHAPECAIAGASRSQRPV